MDQDHFGAVLRELYMDEFALYNERGKLAVDLTDMQIVAVTYALGAFLKGGTVWDGTMAWAGRFLAEASAEELPF